MDEINGRLDNAEENINQLEGIELKTNQNEPKREKEFLKCKQTINK